MNENRHVSTINPCDELRELLPAYILGATTAAEAQKVRELIPQCPEIDDEMKSLANLSASLTHQVEPKQPPAGLRERLLEQATGERDASSATPENVMRPRFRQIGWWVAASVAVLLVVSNVYWLNQTAQMQNEIEFLRTRNDETIQLIVNSHQQQIILSSTAEDNNQVLATLLWDGDANLATVVSDQLAPLDESQTYQLWLIDSDAPVSGGLLPVDSQQTFFTTQLEQNLLDFAAVAISIEPATGSEAPTTDPIAVGEISA